MVRRLTFLLTLLFVSVGLLFGGSAGAPAHNGYDDYDYDNIARAYSFLTVGNILGIEKEDAFKEKGKTLGAELYVFKLHYGTSTKEGELEIREVIFQVPLVSGLKEDEIKNIELVLDTNENGKADPGEPTVGGQGKINPENKVIKFTEPFNHQGDGFYILRADFPRLEEGDFIVIEMEGNPIVIGYEGEDKKVASNYRLSKCYHVEGSPAPVLTWKGQDPYTEDGVDPDQGRSADIFRFSVIYSDINNEPPKVCQVWIDLSKDGQYQEEEKFEMKLVSLSINPDYRTGEEFRVDLALVPTGKEGTVSYKFHFINASDKVALGQGADEEREISIAPLIEAYVWIEEQEKQFVGQKEILLNLACIHYLGVELIEDFEKFDFSPFKVEKVILNPRQPVADSPNEDYQIIGFLITLPKEKNPGVYEIPSVDIHYTASYIVGGKSIIVEGFVKTKPVEAGELAEKLEVEKLPLAFNINYPKEIINIGDRILVTVDIYHEEDREILVGELKEADLKISLAPFEILSLNTKEEDVDGVKLTQVQFVFSLYWVPQQKEESFLIRLPLSQVKIPFRILNGKEGETQEKQFLALPDLPVILNTLVKSDEAPPKWLLGSTEIEKPEFVWFIFWTGVGLVVLFFFILLVTLTKKFIERKKVLSSSQLLIKAEEKIKESSTTIKNLLEAGGEVTHTELVNLFVRFKVYLGLLEGIEISEEEAKAKTSQELLELLEGAGYEKKTTEKVKRVLEILNKVYKQEIKKEDIESLLKRLGDFFLFSVSKK